MEELSQRLVEVECVLNKMNEQRKKDYENTMKPFFNKIRGDKINSVYWNAFKELHEEERDGNPTYKMKIVQLVVS